MESKHTSDQVRWWSNCVVALRSR